jgi:DNA polymerase (family 10)
MASNADLARIFSEMAAVLEIIGGDPFRTNAFRNVARLLGDLTIDVASIASDKKKLTAIDGIGEGTAKRIMEFCQTGKLKEHDDLVAKLPPGLVTLLGIPGVGPKTVKMLWEKAGVTGLESLKSKLESGELKGLPKMGEKTLANIAASLEFVSKASERARIDKALETAENIIEFLKQTKGVKTIEYAGSLRRGMETIGDIDLLAIANDPAALTRTFTGMAMVERVLGSGETKSSVRVIGGMQVDLRIVPDDCFGAALMYFTGSKAHNIVLRERDQKKKLTLNEYGLFPDDGKPRPHERGVEPIAAKTEASVYKALGLPFIPPELRENSGEFELKKTPELIEFDHIKAELHAHTVASDGRLTIEELVQEAKSRGFHTIAVTDHSKSSVQANGLSPERLKKHIDEIREVAANVKGITVLAGAEVDILVDGCLDYEDKLLEQLDIVIASPHASLKQAPAVGTERLLCAIRHPLVHVIGHPTGRMIGRREGLQLDIHKLIDAAVEHNVALEINANPWRLDLRDVHVRAAVNAGALIAIDTDAHGVGDFDMLRYGVLTARRGWLTATHCINAWSNAKLMKWLKSKR